jgi:hypothetical protein
MTTVDFNTHYVPLLKEYTRQLSELYCDNFTENNTLRPSIWNKIQTILCSLSRPLLNLVVTNHADLVEIMLNNLSIDTFKRSMTEWTQSCICIQALLKGAGPNFWNIVSYQMSDITDDFVETLFSLLLPTGARVSSSSSSSSKTFLHSAVITSFEMLADLVMTSDGLTLTQTTDILTIIEEIIARNCPAPTMVLEGKSDGVVIAISVFTQALVDKERQALIDINIPTGQSTSEQLRTYNSCKYNVILSSSYFCCQLCDLVSSALCKENTLDTFKIQTTLLGTSKWIGCISEEYMKMTDLKHQTAEWKLLPLVTQQHQSLGNLIASISTKINLTATAAISSSQSISKLKKILFYVPYFLVSFDSHLKSTSLQLFQCLVELLSSRCCHARSWANPMQILDPLVENESFLTVSKGAMGISTLQSSSSCAFRVILDACTDMTAHLEEAISTLSPPAVSRPAGSAPRRSHTTGLLLSLPPPPSSAPRGLGSDASGLARASSMDSSQSAIKQFQPFYLADVLLNKLFVTAIAGVFSFYDRLRVILHTAFLHIGHVMTESKPKQPAAADSVIAWQELWCMVLPSWEEHLRHLKLRRALFKNNIVPEVSSLPAAPQLISKAPTIVDLSSDSAHEPDPMQDYIKVIASGSAPAPAAPSLTTAASNSTAENSSTSHRVRRGVIKQKHFLKAFDDTSSHKSTSGGGASASLPPSTDFLKPSRATIVKVDMPSSSSSSSSSSSNKKHIVKGGSAALKERLKSREESELMEYRCGGIDDYGDDFAYENAGSRKFGNDQHQQQQYQPQYRTSSSSSLYANNTTKVTDNYSYNSYRRTDLHGFDDFRKKSSKKRGTDTRENSEIIDDFTSKKKPFHHVSDALDTFGDFNGGADLDVGFEDSPVSSYANKSVRGVAKPKPKTVIAAPDITALLGGLSSSSSTTKMSAASRKSDDRSSSTSSNPPLLMSQKSIQDANLTMKQKMAHVNIDDFYLRLLKQSLGTNLSSRNDFEHCPVRFMSEDKYIECFQPLLEAELDAMLSETIASNCANNRHNERQNNFQANIYGPKSASPVTSVPRVYVRCAMIQPRTVSSAVHLNANSMGLQFLTNPIADPTTAAAATTSAKSNQEQNQGYFADSFSDSSSFLEEVRVADVANPDKSAPRMHGPPMKLARDDLVVVLDSNSVHAGNSC